MRPSARQKWATSLQRKLRNPPALFLDFDGTLVSIAPRPEQVSLEPSVRGLVRTLSRIAPVAIISGRSLRDIRARVGLNHITYAGNHGLEISGPGFRYKMKDYPGWRRFLKKLINRLRQDLAGTPGIYLEDKGCTLSVHYRLVRPDLRRKAARLYLNRVQPFQTARRVRLGAGKAMWEIRPPLQWDKGHAVLWILKQSRFRRRWPLYIGDDRTDQDAFRRIRRSGLGIAVGPPRKKGKAHFTVKDPEQVRLLLESIRDYLIHGKNKKGVTG